MQSDVLKSDLLIVGGGAVGLSLADAALRKGISVTLLEKGEIGREASWAGAGMLTCRPWERRDGVTPDHQDLALQSLKLHAAWAARLKSETGIDVGYRVTGALELLENADDENVQRQIAGCNSRGIPARLINKEEIRKLEPNCAEVFAAAIEFPAEAQIRNPRFVRALEASIKAKGARIFSSEVADIAIDHDSDSVCGVKLSDGSTLSAPNVAVCAGAWSGQFPALRQHLPRIEKIHPVRGQILCYEVDPTLAHRLLTVDNHYIVPRGDGVLLVGATHEKVGFDKSVTDAGRAELEQFGHSVLPALRKLQPVRTWAGLRPGMKGRHPLVGAISHVRGLYVNAGHYRSGLTLAPASAELIAKLITGEIPPDSANAWSPA